MSHGSVPCDIGLEEAIAILSAVVVPLAESERIGFGGALGAALGGALGGVLGRVLAEDIFAPVDVPPCAVAAVDGYAFFFDDLETDNLPVVGEVKAGHPFRGVVERGCAWRIFTGAAIPRGVDAEGVGFGPDTVAMQEDCRLDAEGGVILPRGLERGANYRPRGENIAKGSLALSKGVRLGAAEIGLLAAMGVREVSVMRRLRVAVLSIGDELGDALSSAGRAEVHADMLYDSNRPMLEALLSEDGHVVIDGGIIADDCGGLSRAYASLSERADIVVSSGGSSEGAEDHAYGGLLGAGGVVDFWRLALKPGRPMLAGRIGDVPIYALPGNPVAAFVCYRLLVAPMLRAYQGSVYRPPLRLQAPAAFSQSRTRHPPRKSRRDRVQYLRARLTERGVVLHGPRGAGVLASLTGADGLVEIRPGVDEIKEGMLLSFIPLRESGL